MFDKNNLHHAYVIEGEISTSLKEVQKFLEKELKINLVGNIDYFEKLYDGFGIEDAREIKNSLIEKPIGKYKIFVLGIPSMTTQSGNALLKSLEEPSLGTHFFILVSNSKRLLPTLLSRVVLIKQNENEKELKLGISASGFLSLSETKRMDKVKGILEQYDKENIGKQDIISFFRDVLIEYKNKKNFEHEALSNAVIAVDYMSDQSSSLKILMEYITLILK